MVSMPVFFYGWKIRHGIDDAHHQPYVFIVQHDIVVNIHDLKMISKCEVRTGCADT